ncbi:MFS transporter [Halococcus hamelinensis]|uniref:Major facilitator superfamily protein n=1 Tax=Halococcus hamelinensis 100A6 TaxID=1132509 RepID=M0M0Z2_9EURY|nr:MFS transporter [Halococcus hamelinensis]EMA38025.1 major facilitator superfamily protein [Halococcus hamelinensis 100A6]
MNPLSIPRRTVADLWGGSREKMLFSVAFGWFLSISLRMVYPALLPYLRTDYGLSLSTAGLLLSVLWVSYACGQLPGGILADRVGERLLLVVSSVLAATMLTLVVVSGSPGVLFVATALFGVGTALYGVSRFTILEKIYPERLGTATGVTMAAGDLGNSVMPPLAGSIAVIAAWQLGFGFAIPLFLVAAVGLWVTLPERASTGSPTESFGLDGVVSTLTRPTVLLGTMLLVLWSVVMQAVIGFYPTYLTDEKGLSVQAATVLFGFFFALGIVLKPVAGRAFDRVGVRAPLLVFMGGAGIALCLLPFVGDLWLLVLVTVLASGLLGFETIVISDLTQRLPDGAQGTNLGTLRTVYVGLGGLSPILFGAIADWGYFDEAFLGAGALALVVVLVVFATIDY